MNSQQFSPVTFIIVLGTVFMLAPLAIDLYLPAFPTIADNFGVEIDHVEHSLAIFLLGFALGQLVLGPISDTYGRRIVLLGGTLVFIAASFMLATSETLISFYIWRFVQALGGAGGVAVFPLVRDRFNENQSGKIISYIMAVVLVAPVVAPLIGGYILLFWGWRPIFGLIGLVGIVAFLATARILEPSRNTVADRARPLSLRSYVAVLGDRRVLYAVLTGGSVFVGIFAFVAGSPFIYINYYQISAENYGWLVAANGLAMVSTNLINARFLSEISPSKKIIWGGYGLVLASVAGLITSISEWGIVPLVILVSIYFAATALAETNAVIAAFSFRPSDNGSVSALIGAAQFGFGAVASFAVGFIPPTTPAPLVLIMILSGAAALFFGIQLQLLQNGKGVRQHSVG